jgi:hypothetical protein
MQSLWRWVYNLGFHVNHQFYSDFDDIIGFDNYLRIVVSTIILFSTTSFISNWAADMNRFRFLCKTILIVFLFCLLCYMMNRRLYNRRERRPLSFTLSSNHEDVNEKKSSITSSGHNGKVYVWSPSTLVPFSIIGFAVPTLTRLVHD